MLNLAIALVLFFGSYQLHAEELVGPLPSSLELQSILDTYTYDVPYTLKSQKRANAKRKRCWIWNLTYEVDYPNNPNGPLLVTSRVYTPNPKKMGGNKSPFVVLLPPVSGINILDKNMGNELCGMGISGLIITNDFTGFDGKVLPPTEDHMHAFQRAVASVKGAKIFAEQYPHIDPQRMALFGVSLGGILGTLTYSVTPHLRAAYVLVSGSDLPFIMAHSRQSLVKRVRKLRMKQENLQSVDEYEAYLRSFFDHDLNDVAHLAPTESMRMTISRKDSDVPTVKQFELQQALGVPETRYSNSGHSGTVINNMLWKSNRRKIARFLQERLHMDNPRQPAPPVTPPQNNTDNEAQTPVETPPPA